jgi:hypothetical protein
MSPEVAKKQDMPAATPDVRFSRQAEGRNGLASMHNVKASLLAALNGLGLTSRA